MNNIKQLDIFGCEMHEYLFVIEPDQQTIESLIRLRSELNTIIPLSDQTFQSKPHISLCYFEASDFSDEWIVSKANQVLEGINSFAIWIEGCEKWNNGTLILKLRQDEFIQKALQGLATCFKGIIQTPHLTIARNISRELLKDLSISNFQYENNFNCEAILLLRKTGNKPYEVLHKISLPG